MSWLYISCQPFSVAIHRYPSRHISLPRELAAVPLSPAFVRVEQKAGVGKRRHLNRLPCGSGAQRLIPCPPYCNHRCRRLVPLLTFLSAVGERVYFNPHQNSHLSSSVNEICFHGSPPQLHQWRQEMWDSKQNMSRWKFGARNTVGLMAYWQISLAANVYF